MHEQTVAYIGNFRPDWSTENEVRRALEARGHTVIPLQEDDLASWEQCLNPPDSWNLVLWTRTWHLPDFPQAEALAALEAAGIGTVAFHLDRWVGLVREHQLAEEPFFRCALVVTADGDPGHQQVFDQLGIRHRWLPPAIGHEAANAVGKMDRVYAQRPVAFVGSWQQYHEEWDYRRQLVDWMRTQLRGKVALWPRPGQRRIVGQDLVNLYASAKVIVGDSCLAGGISHYWSDRIPETLGRGGFLIHPEVDGLEDHFTLRGPDTQLVTYPLGDWAQLEHLIRYYLKHEDERAAIAQAGREHVRRHHTYLNRVDTLLEWAHELGLLASLRSRSGPVSVTGPHQVRGVFDLRPGSADGITVDEVWREDVYRLQQMDVAGGVVVDVGANCGALTVWAALAGARVVHAYEPQLGNFHRLQDNVEANGVGDQVRVFREGVWNADAREVWVDFPTEGLEAGVQTWEDPPSSLLTGPEDAVTARGLSFVLQRAGDRIRLLKIDCEGCEWPAVFGMDPQDLARVDQIVMEFHGSGMPHWRETPGYDFGQMVAMLAEWGHVEVFGRPSTGGTIYWRRY